MPFACRRSPGSPSPSPLTTIEAQAPAVAADSGAAPSSSAAGGGSAAAAAAARAPADGGGGGGGLGGGNLSVAAALRARLMVTAAAHSVSLRGFCCLVAQALGVCQRTAHGAMLQKSRMTPCNCAPFSRPPNHFMCRTSYQCVCNVGVVPVSDQLTGA